MLEKYRDFPKHHTVYLDEVGVCDCCSDDDDIQDCIEDIEKIKFDPDASYDVVLAGAQDGYFGDTFLKLGFKLICSEENPSSGNICHLYFRSQQ